MKEAFSLRKFAMAQFKEPNARLLRIGKLTPGPSAELDITHKFLIPVVAFSLLVGSILSRVAAESPAPDRAAPTFLAFFVFEILWVMHGSAKGNCPCGQERSQFYRAALPSGFQKPSSALSHFLNSSSADD